MAITTIHPIKATVDKAIAYICNPEKTDDSLLITSFGCSPQTAHYDFAFTRSKADQKAVKLAHHLIQAFKPGEVTSEEAHQIGREFADKVLGGRYSYVLTTHIDCGHVHNHIIFNAVDNENYRHYNDCIKTYYGLRRVNDQICAEHNLSVIDKGSRNRGQTWYQWKLEVDDEKRLLRKELNQAADITESWEEFLAFLRAKGVRVKEGGTLSFNAPGSTC